jgi:hypothetical protein
MRIRLLSKYGLVLPVIYFLSLIPDGYAQSEVSIDPDGGLALHVWDRYVRRFRRDHNLSLSYSYQSVDWHIKRLGDLTDKVYRSSQSSMILDYTFHILIAGKTGYFLGSSAGYVFARQDKLSDEFKPASSWLLPGVRAGFSYNYDPSGRIFLGMGAQLERFNGLRTRRLDGDWQAFSITGETFQVYGGADFFFVMDTAIHVAVVRSVTLFQKPSEAQGFLVDSRMSRQTVGGELGVLMHFL